jgi:hypothetical protein
MWGFIKRVFTNPTPSVGIQANPLVIGSAKHQRNLERISRIKQAIAAGDKRRELKQELARREKEAT